MSNAGNSTGTAPVTAPATRAATKEAQQKIITEHYGGDINAYYYALNFDAEDTCSRAKTLIASIETRCAAYMKSRRVASTWISSLEQDKHTLDIVIEAYCSAITKCTSFDLSFKEGKNVESYRDKLKATRNAAMKANTTLTECLAYCESAVAEYNAAQPPQRGQRHSDGGSADEEHDGDGAEARRPKLKAQIKVDKLTVSSTPAQLDKWANIFRCYCEYSNLLAASKFYQQQVCYSYMDEALTAYLQGKVEATTPLFGDDPHVLEAPAGTAQPGSVIFYLYEKFEATYPLSARRSMLLKMAQQPGQAWSVFYTKWDAAMRNADFERYLVGDVVQVELLIANTIDKELVDRFQKLENPKRDDLLATAVKYEADLKAQKSMRVGGGDSGPAARRIDSSGKQRHQGGNRDNYIRDHFKKLEADGKCVRCAQPIGSKTLEEHKEVCKAKDAKCKFCVSQNFGSRAKGHLEAACAKKLHHARARLVEAGGSGDEEEPTAQSAHVSSSEEEFDPHVRMVTVEGVDTDVDDDGDASNEDDESEVDTFAGCDDDWLALPGYDSYSNDWSDVATNGENSIPDNDVADEWLGLPGYYSYSSDSDNDDEDDGWEVDRYWSDVVKDQAEYLPVLVETNTEDVAPAPNTDSAVHRAQPSSGLSRSARRRRRRQNAAARARAARRVPMAYVLENISDVPKNIPIPLFDIQFRQHERRGPWHSIAAVADTGANRSIFSTELINRAGISIRTNGRERIRLASGTASMASSGHAFLRIKTPGDSKRDYTVVNALISPSLKEDALISYNDLKRLRVISDDFPARLRTHNNNNTEPFSYFSHVDQMNDIADRFPDVFDAKKLTPLKVPPMEINVNRNHPDYKPLRTYTARKTPLHFEDNADELLKYLIDTGVIKRADPNRTYEWVSPAFFVPKRNGKARLVIDFSRLSKFCERTPHPFPSPRDVIRSIKPESRWFLVADLRNGYFQLQMSEEATKFTAFLLPQGLFIMCRGPQGLSPTSDNFVAATDYILEGLDLVKIIDDCLIQGETPEQCLEVFEELCKRCQKFGVTLTRDKLRLAQEVTFAGWVISKDGIRSDPYKLAAIAEFPTPKNLRDLRSFCGAITQLNLLSPDIAHAMHGLRPLLKAKNHFEWTAYHDKEFNKVRSLVTKEMSVKPFDMKLPTRIYVDASRLYGMGYALCNVETDTVTDDDGHQKTVERLRIIQCNSRALQPAETRYATNELECGALVWSIMDCRHYVLGLDGFDVYTDHRALEVIFRQPLAEVVNARMLRMRHRVSDYRFQVKWQSGSRMLLADALSRNPLFAPPEEDDSADDSAMINLIAADPALQALYEAAEEDDDYKSLLEVIKSGVPLKNLPDSHYAKRFCSVYDNLSYFQSLLILNDSRIVVPKAMRPFIVNQVHSAHTGKARCLHKARAEFFWPGMTEDIERAVDSCEACQKFSRSQPEEEILSFPPTTEPMQLVGSDLFSFAGDQHVIMADAFSGMIFVKRLARETSTAVINALMSFFRLIGLPQNLMSDNGPCYDSEEFKEFCLTYNIKHLTSSPGHPRSNGLSESHVANAKNLLRKCDSYNQFQDRLLDLMTMPGSGETKSPSEKFFGRKLRTLLPILTNFYNPVEGNEVKPAFAIGDRVRLQDIRTQLWDRQGTVTAVRPVGRSFEVTVDGGGYLIRNRRFMKKLTEAKSDTNTDNPPQSTSRPDTEHPLVVDSDVDAPPPVRRPEDSTRGDSQHGVPHPRRSKRLAARRAAP